MTPGFRETKRLPVLYSLPDGAQSSVLLRTALFDRLTSVDDLQWVFASPLAENAEFARVFERPGVRLVPWPGVELSFWERQIQMLRKERWRLRVGNATSEIFARRMRWMEPRRYHLHRRTARFGSWIPGFDGLLDGLDRHVLGDGGWGRLLDELQPVAVVFGSGGTKLQEGPLARAARRRGIPCFNIIPSWDNLTSKGPLCYQGQRLAVWCERMRREAVDLYGCRPDDVVVTGPPPFDPHASPPPPAERQRFLKELGLDPARRLITYTSVHPDACPFSIDFVAVLARLIESGRLPASCQLLVRLHPQDDHEAFAKLPTLPHVVLERPGRYHGHANRNRAIFEYDPSARDVRHLTETLAFSDVVINVASTITLEACALDRPVINLAYNLESQFKGFDIGDYYRLTHYRPVTDSGAVAVVRSEHELRVAMIEALLAPKGRSLERWRLYGEYDPFRDGRASERLADAILDFIEEVAYVDLNRPGRSRTDQQTVADRRAVA